MLRYKPAQYQLEMPFNQTQGMQDIGEMACMRGETFHKSKQIPAFSSLRPQENTCNFPPNTMSRNLFVNGTRNYRKENVVMRKLKCDRHWCVM
ncbi:hypothetical protein OnM2_045104 [Erysiphe neolycopersici]|uniref:Uncharacterized protein n=1 Tax=Erysiphe neolycopersici TaxID=212602 RepID=A0A420HU95_9PEZI|nr:hypothetical protein OnM2_045104 [Erysiphe neolycopersici]